MDRKGKLQKLADFFALHPKAVLGFSGGVDSAFLFAAAREAGAELSPVFVKTPFQPAFELRDAREIATQLNVPLEVVDADPLSDPEIIRNDAQRCYYCKRMIFSLLRKKADARGAVLIDGTNASDPEDDRPGMKALRELGALSPLREAGLTKADIRSESKARALFTWKKPSYACLATRIPTGTPVELATLQKVEAAEDALFALGLSDFRVRVFHGAARLQLRSEDWPLDERLREKITEALQPYFETVLLDMVPRATRE